MVGLAYTASAADKPSSSECEHMVYGCCAALSCTRTSYQHMITPQSCERHVVSLSGDCRYRHVTVCTLLSCKSSSMAHPHAVHSMYPDGTCVHIWVSKLGALSVNPASKRITSSGLSCGIWVCYDHGHAI